MIPYNPSSFNSNKTILEQILEIKKWLIAHPSYKVYYCTSNFMPTGNDDRAFSEIAGTEEEVKNIAVGDLLVFPDAYYSEVIAVDLDNEMVTIGLPATNFSGPQGATGPQGPQGPTGPQGPEGTYKHYVEISTSTGTFSASELALLNYGDSMIIKTTGTSVSIYKKDRVTSSNVALFRRLNYQTSSPFGTMMDDRIEVNTSTGAYSSYLNDVSITKDNIKSVGVSSVKLLKSNGSGGTGWDFIEGTEVKSTGITSGKVLQADGNGNASWGDAGGGLVELEIAYADIGQALSDSDYAICLNADKMIVNYGSGQLIEYTRDSESSTEIKFTRMYGSGIDTIVVTKATKVVTNPTNKLLASDLSSGSATSGQVLQADGNGGASWQNAGGGSLYLHSIICKNSTGTRVVAINYLTGTSTQFTRNTFIAELYAKGYNNSKPYQVSGAEISGNAIIKQYVYVYANSSSSTLLGTFDTAQGTFWEPSGISYGDFQSFSDNVTQLL